MASQAGGKPWYSRGCSAFEFRPIQATSPNAVDILRAVLLFIDRMWDSGTTLTCAFVDPSATPLQHAKVKAVAKEWEEFANIHFQFVEDSHATIRIAFKEEEGSWSAIGKELQMFPETMHNMNYARVSSSPEITEEEKGVILHEFGHALGYIHEHKAFVKGGSTTLSEPDVNRFYKLTRGLAVDKSRQIIVEPYNQTGVTNFHSVDPTSAMRHVNSRAYFMPKEMNNERLEIPPTGTLSELDKIYSRMSYGFEITSPKIKEWSIDHALDAVEVDEFSRRAILSRYEMNDWEAVRFEFIKVCCLMRSPLPMKHASSNIP